MTLEAIHQRIADTLASLAKLFVPGCKLTFYMRHPDNPDACIIVTDDQPESIVKGIAHTTKLKEQDGEWFVVDRNRNNAVIRGPYKHAETAGFIRCELESRASDSQNERWNLCCDYHEKQKP